MAVVVSTGRSWNTIELYLEKPDRWKAAGREQLQLADSGSLLSNTHYRKAAIREWQQLERS